MSAMQSSDRSSVSSFSRFRALFVVLGIFLGGVFNFGKYFLFQPPRFERLEVVDREFMRSRLDGDIVLVHLRHDGEPFRYPAHLPGSDALESMRPRSGEQVQLWADATRTIWQLDANNKRIVSYDEASQPVREKLWSNLRFGVMALAASIVGGAWIWWRDWRTS
jgi:hypothetical protein